MRKKCINQESSFNMIQNIAYSLSEQVVTIVNTYNAKNSMCKTEAEAISQCLLQMGCEKMMSVVTLLNNGINIQEKGIIKAIPSLFSYHPIVRSLYELMMIHHCLFVNPKTEEEANVLLDLWKIKGYCLRVKYENIHPHEEQKEKELQEIKTMKNRIKETRLYKECKQQLSHAFDTDKICYLEFTTKKGKLSLQATSFGNKALFNRVYMDLNIMPQIENDMVYNYLSMNTHPTYLSVIQFGTQNSMTTNQIIFPLKCATLFVYRMIKSHEYLLQNSIYYKH